MKIVNLRVSMFLLLSCFTAVNANNNQSYFSQPKDGASYFKNSGLASDTNFSYNNRRNPVNFPEALYGSLNEFWKSNGSRNNINKELFFGVLETVSALRDKYKNPQFKKTLDMFLLEIHHSKTQIKNSSFNYKNSPFYKKLVKMGLKIIVNRFDKSGRFKFRFFITQDQSFKRKWKWNMKSYFVLYSATNGNLVYLDDSWFDVR